MEDSNAKMQIILKVSAHILILIIWNFIEKINFRMLIIYHKILLIQHNHNKIL